MAVKIEALPDASRGPGCGILRIDGLPEGEGELDISIRSNQSGNGHLGAGGAWVAETTWHRLPPPSQDGSALLAAIGPDLVNTLATLLPNIMLQASLRFGGGKPAVGPLVVRGLRAGDGRSAPAIQSPPEPEPEPVPELVVQPIAEPVAEPEPIVPSERILASAPPPRQALPKAVLVALAAVVVLALAGAGAYFGGVFDHKAAAPAVPPPVAETTPQPQPTGTPTAPAEIATRDDLNRFIQTNPGAAAILAQGQSLAGKGKLDLAMLAYQVAARAGSADAAMAVARMYDPETWSKTSSPMAQSDAETAAYWYEPPAQAGNVEAERRLGKILVDLNPSGFQRDKGREWLQKAAAAGDDKAKALLGAVK